MRLLFDQNLSPFLVELLADFYPGSVHVQAAGLDHAPDEAVWDYAKKHGLLIVTKDTDFPERSVIAGAPPKVVWIRRGNCSTKMVEEILRRHCDEIRQLSADRDTSYLVLI